jgi:lipopolysaccharide assembly outer membrane protein LptD (OstA)
MKLVIQLTLLSIVVIILIIFYQTYFVKNEKIKLTNNNIDEETISKKQNNKIKNLKYDVTLDGNNQYSVTADQSEITYENDFEIVNMEKVSAIFIDQTNIPLTITADYAIYNNSNYNTNFKENVEINYLNRVIVSNNVDINFDVNTVTIYGNVVFEGLEGTIKTDNVKINLITKKIQIYMNDKKKKVELTTNL